MRTLPLLLVLACAAPVAASEPAPPENHGIGDLFMDGGTPATPLFGTPQASLFESPLLQRLRDSHIAFPHYADPSRPWLSVTPREGLSIDLRSQWDWMARNQGIFGTCTAFATVALYEAAMLRAGRCARLSEGDLYLQANVLKWTCWTDGGDSCRDHVEGYNIQQMSEHMQTVGVLSGDNYSEFMNRFVAAREADGQTAQLFRQFLRNPFQYAPLFQQVRATTRAQLSTYARQSQTPVLTRARGAVAATVAGYQRVWRSWRITIDPNTASSARCREAAAEQERMIDGELVRGRPVAVSMALNGLTAWNQGASQGQSTQWHAFIIKGMRVLPDGSKYYTTRNSWGGENPLVYADQLCRVDYAESLLVPGERPAIDNFEDALYNRR